ncbi:hypothetical protein H8N03_12105 [Ramlibacter sp. USB13]|uniref:Uncharacterized protein n=1 Tax=Ramlibacter cellulosilyticus TaxID=2764187 RepID=A0A923MRQ3_9BURK|nr:hypothetical protein [Ramlibacter cellulosilyticus]MBC5783691.1 hypothetical protein [Ramlibacter cellulosilyticus]
MIPVKTALGQQVLKDRSVELTLRQRAALIVIDGKRSIADVLQQAGVQPEDVSRLLELQLIEGMPAPGSVPQVPGPAVTPQQRYAAAYPIAARLTAGLGLRGARLNIAVEGATCYDELVAIAGKIREAVGTEKFAPLAAALQLR